MHVPNILKIIALAISLQVMVACANQAASTAPKSTPIQSENNDGEEPEYIFSGKCPNGDRYRLHLYKSDFEGSTGWYYNYQGPVGKGTVKTNTPPKTMAVRVCRGLAEIASDQL